jgi:RNA polymerase sigma factor (sigma-70 family)
MPTPEAKKRLADWFRQWRSPLRRFLSGRGAVRVADFDDIAQEVFLRLLRYETTDLVEHPQAYVFKVASNVAAEWAIRSRYRLAHEPRWLASLVIEDHVDEALDSMVAQREIARALGTLSPRECAILKLHFEEGLSHAGIADRLGLSQRTERRELMLSDGSVVRLEPESRLRVTFDSNERRVVLEKGRALFRVAKNPQRPFLVQVDDTTVRAVGTAFGVEHRAGGIVVTVAEGSVAVTVQALRNEAMLEAGGSEPTTQLLTAGQQVTVQSSGAANSARRVDTERALAWAEGRLVFEDDTLADVVAEFNRYNRTQLRIADPQLAARRISGVFEATDTETLLAFIRAGSHVTLTRRGDDEISIASDP